MTMQENERIERRVPIDEIALQQEDPKQGDQEGNDDFRQEEKVGRTVCTQRGCPRRAHHGFGEQIRSVGVEKKYCPPTPWRTLSPRELWNSRQRGIPTGN